MFDIQYSIKCSQPSFNDSSEYETIPTTPARTSLALAPTIVYIHLVLYVEDRAQVHGEVKYARERDMH